MHAKCLPLVSIVLAAAGSQARSDQAGGPAVRDTVSLDAGPDAQSLRRSDTMHVYIHNVKAGKEAEYETWVREVWIPSLDKAGQKYPEVSQTNKGQRLFAPTGKQKDGSSN